MYYNECPYCGAHLDPGERCDCEIERKKRGRLFKRHYNNLFEYMEDLENERVEI
ncbi:hypothetical protein HMPREF0980_03570 [Dorea sp. D27]|nr:hypothetical protein HMPREF0980_03570 [Dorea sp. D27]